MDEHVRQLYLRAMGLVQAGVSGERAAAMRRLVDAHPARTRGKPIQDALRRTGVALDRVARDHAGKVWASRTAASIYNEPVEFALRAAPKVAQTVGARVLPIAASLMPEKQEDVLEKRFLDRMYSKDRYRR